MRFSAFAPFGALRFSSRRTHGENIYRQMVADLGGGKNYSEDFDSLAMARVYANAMTFARAKYALDRAGSQFRPSRALELLPALEAEYGITPDADATISERRSELAVAMRIARGARRDNVESILDELLGVEFVEYETIDTADAVTSTATPEDQGVYVLPGTEKSLFRLTEPVSFTGTPVTVTYEAVAGAHDELAAGDKIIIDTGDFGRIESVTISSVGTSGSELTLTATFTRPHNNGTALCTGRFPYLQSSKRHNVFQLSEDGMASARTQRRANRAISRLLRGVSTWALTDSDDSFTVSHGLLEVTLIGEDNLPVESPPIATNLVLHFDMQDYDSFTVTNGRVTSLTNKASSVAWTSAEADAPYIETDGLGGEPCLLGNGGEDLFLMSTEAAVVAAAAGSDPAFTVYIVVKPFSLDVNETYLGFGHSGFAGGSRAVSIGQSTTSTGRRRLQKIDDAAATTTAESTVATTTDVQVNSWIVPGTTASGYLNDGSASPSETAFNGGPTTLTHVALFGIPGAGTVGAGGNHRIGEVLLYTGAHTTEQHAETVQYLMNKWSI